MEYIWNKKLGCWGCHRCLGCCNGLVKGEAKRRENMKMIQADQSQTNHKIKLSTCIFLKEEFRKSINTQQKWNPGYGKNWLRIPDLNLGCFAGIQRVNLNCGLLFWNSAKTLTNPLWIPFETVEWSSGIWREINLLL